MMSGIHDPGGEVNPPGHRPTGMSFSWASLLGGNLPIRNDNNVMEIVLEKDERGIFNASVEEVAKALQKLGADLRPGVHIEGVQICPMGKNVIQVTLNKNVDMSRFCNKEVFELRNGVRISQVRQSGKREVILTIKGLHPNTKDETVFKYLNCIGKMEKKKVIMETYREGPLAGLKNGTRKYTMEVRQDIPVGTTHFIDGSKVNFNFPGQKKFCFRCYKVDRECVGRGLARECEANGGLKVFFSDHILDFWKKIKYAPDETFTTADLETENDVEVQVGGNFTPKGGPKIGIGNKDQSSFGAVSVKWFPKKADPGEIKKFLVDLGLPIDHDNINIKENGQVVIGDLTSVTCQQLAESISGQRFQNKKMIYCQPIILATPVKVPASTLPATPVVNIVTSSAPGTPATPAVITVTTSAHGTPATAHSGTAIPTTPSPGHTPPPMPSIANTSQVATTATVMSSSTISSIMPPPPNIQPNGFTFSPRPKSKLLNGSASDSDTDPAFHHDPRLDTSDRWLTMNETKRQKRQKRKQQEISPDLVSFKKQDKKITPKHKKKQL